MKKITLITLIGFTSFSIYAQQKKLSFRVFVSPSLCRVSTTHRLVDNGQVMQTNMSKSQGLFFGGGVGVLRHLKNNWLVGGEVGFVPKGYLAVRDKFYYNGTGSGWGFTRVDLNFLESTLFVEREVLTRDPRYRFMFTGGLFYGLHLPNIIGFAKEANGNDFGTSFSVGAQRKQAFLALDYKKGLINIKNNVNASFKTNMLSFKLGLSI